MENLKHFRWCRWCMVACGLLLQRHIYTTSIKPLSSVSQIVGESLRPVRLWGLTFICLIGGAGRGFTLRFTIDLDLKNGYIVMASVSIPEAMDISSVPM